MGERRGHDGGGEFLAEEFKVQRGIRGIQVSGFDAQGVDIFSGDAVGIADVRHGNDLLRMDCQYDTISVGICPVDFMAQQSAPHVRGALQ